MKHTADGHPGQFIALNREGLVVAHDVDKETTRLMAIIAGEPRPAIVYCLK